MDEKSRAPNAAEFVENIETFFIYFGRVTFSLPIWRFYPTTDWKLFEKSGRYIYKVVTEYIEEAKAKLEKGVVDNKDKYTILSQFLSRREKHNLDMKDIVAIMTDFIMAGVDTVCKKRIWFFNLRSNKLNNFPFSIHLRLPFQCITCFMSSV